MTIVADNIMVDSVNNVKLPYIMIANKDREMHIADATLSHKF